MVAIKEVFTIWWYHLCQVTFKDFNLDILSLVLNWCLIQLCTILSFKPFTTAPLYFPYLFPFGVFIGFLFLSFQLCPLFLFLLQLIPSVPLKDLTSGNKQVCRVAKTKRNQNHTLLSLSVFDITCLCESEKQVARLFFLWKCCYAVDNQNFE